MSDAQTPQFRVSNEGEPIPPVDPEDLKRRWSTRKERQTCDVKQAAQGQEADRIAVWHRFRMVSALAEGFNHGQLLAPWKHDEELDDAVFRLAATFPMRPLRQQTYRVPGDSMFGFDPNAFVEKLVEETGISHTWEPVPSKTSGSGFSYVWLKGGPRDPVREAKQDARDLLWAVWSKCQPNLSRPSGKHADDAESIAMVFADFVIDNIHLAREFVSVMSGGEGRPELTIVLQLERNAVWGDYFECSVCHRLMREHSDEELTHCQHALPPGTTLYRVRTS